MPLIFTGDKNVRIYMKIFINTAKSKNISHSQIEINL